jgi:hypothetical protein
MRRRLMRFWRRLYLSLLPPERVVITVADAAPGAEGVMRLGEPATALTYEMLAAVKGRMLRNKLMPKALSHEQGQKLRRDWDGLFVGAGMAPRPHTNPLTWPAHLPSWAPSIDNDGILLLRTGSLRPHGPNVAKVCICRRHAVWVGRS